MVPVSPSRRTNSGHVRRGAVEHAEGGGIARTGAGTRSWFFGENRSIDGEMIETMLSGGQAGTYSRRENTSPDAAVRCGHRKSQPARVAPFSQLTPMWQRHATERQPSLMTGQAGGLRVMQQGHIAGSICPSSSTELAVSIRVS